MKKKPKLTAQANSYGYKKYLLAMKLTTLLILLNLMPLSASIYSQNANFSFKFHNATVKEVLNQMEQQSQFRFFYNDNFIDLNRKITLNVKNVKIEELLSNLLDASAVTYKILDNNLIVITPKEVYKQQKISGVVTDATTNEPLIGVGISVQGTTQGTITDADGKYSIDVPGSASTIVVSYVGYKKQEITAGNNMVINISLIQEFTNLEEVVVVGYGVQKKSLLTGAIGSVKSDDLKNSSFQRADEAFEGKIAGIQAIPTSGAPGAALNIRIRGYGSNGNSNPLFIVDGIISADISNLDPNDILSEEVLKDAASSAIYGAQGGNGVIIITTKKGESGKSLVTYNIQYAHQTPSHLAKELNSTDYVTFMNEKNGFGVSQADGVVGGNIAQFTQGGVPVNNNWLKSVFTNGTQVKHNLSFSGGNDKTTFYSALNYLKNDGIVTGSQDKYERFTFRINAENKSNKWLKVGTNLEYSHSNTRGINENGAEFGGVVGSALQIDPTTPVEYTNGTPDWLTNEIKGQPALIKAPDGNPYGVSHLVAGEIRNPFVTQALTNGVITLDKILGGFYADISPIKGLIFTSRLGLDFSDRKSVV